MTGKELAEKGFYKVGENGGAFVSALFVNPETWETKLICVRDYDYSDGSRDNDELYYMPINEEVKNKWHMHVRKVEGIVGEGDTVKVVKGRKIPIGTVAVVESIRPWKDKYGRVQTEYAVFTDGRKTSVNNCVIIKFADGTGGKQN